MEEMEEMPTHQKEKIVCIKINKSGVVNSFSGDTLIC
jgi:hypothetical protein